MSKKKQKSIEELLEEALVPEEEQPYKVPENWVWVRSGHVAKWGSGGTPSRKRLEYYGGDIPWIKTGELNDGIVNASEETITEEGLQNSSAKIFPKGSIVIAMYGATIGKLGILGIDAATNQACAVGQPYDFLNSKYMLYYFLARRSDLIVLGKGGAQPNISQTIIKDFPFALPPLNEQKRIAEKIERLFAKLDEAKRLIEEVKESFELQWAAILDKAFKGQLGTNDPNEKSMLETSNHIKEKDLIPKEEQPYEVPKNWVWVRSSHVAKWGSGGTPSRKKVEYYGGDIPWIKTGELNDGIVNTSEETITEEGLQNSSAKIFPKGSIVIAMYGATIGKLGILGIDAATNQACAVGQPHDFLNSKYMFYYFLARRSDLIALGKGGAQPNISQTIIKDFPFALPPLNEQKRIAEKVDNLLSKLETEKDMVLEVEEKFDLLKQSILNKAFRGELGTNDLTDKHAIELLKEVLKSK